MKKPTPTKLVEKVNSITDAEPSAPVVVNDIGLTEAEQTEATLVKNQFPVLEAAVQAWADVEKKAPQLFRDVIRQVRVALSATDANINQAEMRSYLLSKGWDKSRVSDVITMALCADEIFQRYMDGTFGLKPSLQLARNPGQEDGVDEGGEPDAAGESTLNQTDDEIIVSKVTKALEKLAELFAVNNDMNFTIKLDSGFLVKLNIHPLKKKAKK